MISKGVLDRRWGVCVDQIFTLRQIGEKAREKKHRIYVDLIDLKKYDGGRGLARLATRSEFSLPGSPTWDGIQQKEMSLRWE